MSRGGLVSLRNMLAHAGGVSRQAGAELLGEHEPVALRVLERVAAALSGIRTFHVDGAGVVTELTGPRPVELREAGRPAALNRGWTGKVVVVDGDTALDITPLCLFGRPLLWRAGKPARQGDAAVPHVYFKTLPARYLYNALGSSFPMAQGPDETRDRFSRLLKAADDVEDPALSSVLLESINEARADAYGRVGRTEELRRIGELCLGRRTGLLWLDGSAGSGKSTLCASLATEVFERRRDGEPALFYYRFRIGSGHCSKTAFIENFLRWLDELAAVQGDDLPERLQRLRQKQSPPEKLLHDALKLCVADFSVNPLRPVVLVVIDGMDEVARTDPLMASLPVDLRVDGVVWLVASRPEPELVSLYSCAERIFPPEPDNPAGGLPPMKEVDVRAMLVEKTEAARYDLIALDRDSDGRVQNAFVEQVARNAHGLPIYVKLVVEDLLSGQLSPGLVDDLPPGLESYYEQLLARYGIDDLHVVVTPLVALLAVSEEPLSEKTIAGVLASWLAVVRGGDGEQLVRAALARIGAMLQKAATPEGQVGFTLYHDAFRQHVLASGATAATTRVMREALADCSVDVPTFARGDEVLARHLYRCGVRYCIAAGRADAAANLLGRFDYHAERFEVLQDGQASAVLLDVARCAAAGHPIDPAWHRLLRSRSTVLVGGATPVLSMALLEPRDSAPRNQADAWLAGHSGMRYLRPLAGPACADDGALRQTIRACGGIRLAYAAGTRRCAVAGQSLYWLDLDTGHLTESANVQAGRVRAMQIAPDGKRLALVGLDGRLRIWNLEGDCIELDVDVRAGWGFGVAWHPDGSKVAIATSRGRAKVLSAEDGRELEDLAVDGAHARVVTFALDGSLLLAAGSAGVVRAFEWGKGRTCGAVRVLDGSVRAIAALPGGRTAWVAGDRGQVREISVPELAVQQSLNGAHLGDVRALALSRDGRLLASGGDDLVVKLWSAETLAAVEELEGSGAPITSIAFADGPGELVGCNEAQAFMIWRRGQAPAVRRPRHRGAITCMDVSSRGRVVSGGVDGRLLVWDAGTGALVGESSPHQGIVNKLVADANGDRAASAGRDMSLHLWSPSTGQVLWTREFDTYVRRIHFLTDEPRVLVGLHGGRVHVFDAQRGTVCAEYSLPTDYFDGLALQGSQWVDWAGGLKWNALTGESVPWRGLPLMGHVGFEDASDVAFGPPGVVAAMCQFTEASGEVDVTTGLLPKILSGLVGPVRSSVIRGLQQQHRAGATRLVRMDWSGNVQREAHFKGGLSLLGVHWGHRRLWAMHDGRVELLDVDSLSVVRELELDRFEEASSIHALSYAPGVPALHGDIVAVLDSRHEVVAFDAATGDCLGRFATPGAPTQVKTCAGHVVVGDERGDVTVLRPESTGP